MFLGTLRLGLFSELLTCVFGVIEIVGDPQTIPNATIGGTASFECIINSETVLPSWNINGIDFSVTELPPGVSFDSNSFSKVLTVSPVTKEMNNSCFYCFLLLINGREESSRAKLIIRPPTLSHNIISRIIPVSTTSQKKTSAPPTSSVLSSHLYPLHANTAVPSAKIYCSLDNDLNRNESRDTERINMATSHFILLLIAVSTTTVIIASTFSGISLLIFCRHRKKKSSNKKYPVYDEVTLPESPDVHNNPAYANPGRMRLEENPAYVSTHQQ